MRSNEQAEDDDAHAERPDARALEFADGNLVEAEVGGELSRRTKSCGDESVAGG